MLSYQSTAADLAAAFAVVVVVGRPVALPEPSTVVSLEIALTSVWVASVLVAGYHHVLNAVNGLRNSHKCTIQ